MKTGSPIKIFLFTLVSFIHNSSFCQLSVNKILDNKTDLANENCNTLLRDSKGFLWLGTYFGLMKFDGQNKEYYFHDPSNPHSLLGKTVHHLFEDGNKVIWIGFRNGISQYNPSTNLFINFTKENGGIDSEFSECSFFQLKSDLYVSARHQGLFQYDIKSCTFKKIVSTDVTGTNFSAVAAPDRSIILCGPKGLFKYDPNCKDITKIATFPSGLSSIRTLGVKLVTDENIWIGTWGDGLLQYNFHKKKFNSSIYDHRNVLKSFTNIVSDIIAIPNLDGGNEIYVATGNGIYRFDENNYIELDKCPRIFNQPVYYFIHNKNNLWIVHREKGIYRMDLKLAPFQLLYNSPTGLGNFNRLDNGNLFISDTDPALVILDSNYSIKYSYKYLPKHIMDEASLISWISIYNPFDNQIYSGTFNGLCSVDPNGTKYRWYPPHDSLGLIGKKVIRILPLDSNFMIIGYWKNSVQILNYKTGKNHKILIPGKLILWNIKYEVDGNIYLCLNHAIYTYNHLMNELNRLEIHIPGEEYMDINLLPNSQLLVGTNYGLYIFDLVTCKLQKKFGHKGEICFKNVESIVPLDYPNFLLLTNVGLVHFNIQTDQCNTLSNYWPELAGGLRLKQLRNGEILAAEGNNLYRIFPDRLNINIPIHTYITSISTNKRDIFPPDETDTQNKIIVKPDEKQIKFNLAAIDEYLSKNILLEYQLSGTSEKWISLDKQRNITFFNLPYGTYKFSVRVKDQDHNLSKVSIINFEITEYFYNKSWFRLLLTIIIIGLILQMIYKIQNQNIKMKAIELTNQLKTQKAIADERNKLAKDLHDDLGSQVSAMRLMIEVSKLNTTDQSTRDELFKFEEFCIDLANKIRETIWVTHDMNSNWEAIIGYISQYARSTLDSLDIELIEKITTEFPNVTVNNNIKKNIFLAFKEVINNIIKHANATCCEIKYEYSKEEIILSIKDNGIGFVLEEESKIRWDGSGNGIKNIIDRIENIKGKVYVESTPGSGCTIRICIPVLEN